MADVRSIAAKLKAHAGGTNTKHTVNDGLKL